ncbi:MAG: dihydroorotase [Spirochaetaceae bacterium]|jgi:dihydroorotase|nr:dihydroorotase [Spirochaetaceae bacterium]
MKTIFWNFRIADAHTDEFGTVIADKGVIIDVLLKNKKSSPNLKQYLEEAHVLLDGQDHYVLMPGFIDMHAHFRSPGYEYQECLESGSLAAAAGGFTTVVCMANTNPPIDNLVQAAEIRRRANIIGLIDLYPAVSLTKKMEGKALSEINLLKEARREKNINVPYTPLIFSEDGNDVESSSVFSRAFAAAAELNIPVSCHCDIGGEDAATERALDIGIEAGAHVHIAHLSTKNALDAVRKAKNKVKGRSDFAAPSWVSCEATPHHIALTEKYTRKTGAAAAVAPPLRSNADRRAIIEGLMDGAIDVIATDHAPRTLEEKARGMPGFSGLETAFSICYQTLVIENKMPLSRLSALLSYNPAVILGLADRGVVRKGLKADLVIVEPNEKWTFNADCGKSRGLNNPFSGRELTGRLLFTMRSEGDVLAPLGKL